jgi:hypothetical protein
MTRTITKRIAGLEFTFTRDSLLARKLLEWEDACAHCKEMTNVLAQREDELGEVKHALGNIAWDCSVEDIAAALSRRQALEFIVSELRRRVDNAAQRAQDAHTKLSQVARSVHSDLLQIERLEDPEQHIGNLGVTERREQAERLKQGVYERTGIRLEGKRKSRVDGRQGGE